MNRFTCARCKGTFESEWSDEEAVEEAEALFGTFDKQDAAKVCDDCYAEFVAWYRKEYGVELH
jgi:hypothetical protein